MKRIGFCLIDPVSLVSIHKNEVLTAEGMVDNGHCDSYCHGSVSGL